MVRAETRRSTPRAGITAATLATLAALAAGCFFFVDTRGPSLAAEAVAPELALRAADGEVVTLERLLVRGPAVLVFYRGFW